MARTVGIGLSISSDTKVYNASFCPIALPAQLDPTIKFAEWHVTLPCGARAGVFRLSFAGLEPRRTPFFCEKNTCHKSQESIKFTVRLRRPAGLREMGCRQPKGDAGGARGGTFSLSGLLINAHLY